MRVRVVVGLVAEHEPVLLEVPDHERVGIEHLLADPVGHVRRVPAVLVHRDDGRDAGGVRHDLVVLAEAGSEVDDAGAVVGGDEVGGEDLERVAGAVLGRVREVVEQRAVAAPASSEPLTVPTRGASASSAA